MKRVIGGFILGLVLLGARPTGAEPLIIPLAVYAAGASTDLHSTYRFLQYEGFREANPLVKGLSSQPKTLVGVSVIGDALTVYGLHKLVNMKALGGPHPKFERVALYAAASIRFLYAIDNYRAITPESRRKR